MAAPKSKEYWEKRHEQWWDNQEKDDNKVTKDLEKQYAKMSKEVERDIAEYFAKYSKDDVIEFRTLLQDINDADRRLLFEDMDSFAAKYPQHARLMPVRESIYKLNRLQGLHHSMNMKLLELGAVEQEVMEEHLLKTYGKNYKALMVELGLGSTFVAVSSNVIRDAIYQKWVNGQNFSERIWGNKEKMLGYMQNEFRDGLARGDNYKSLSRAMQKRFEVGAGDARRLVQTEAAFVLNQSHRHGYTQNGVIEYDIDAVMDGKTSKICRNMDGQRFRFDESVAGLNFPPFHARCRTTFTGVLDNFL